MPAHSARSLLVILRVQLIAQCFGSFRKQRYCNHLAHQYLCSASQHGSIADGKVSQSQVGEGTAVNLRLCRKAGDGVVAISPRKLMEKVRGVLWWHWKLNGDQQFFSR